MFIIDVVCSSDYVAYPPHSVLEAPDFRFAHKQFKHLKNVLSFIAVLQDNSCQNEITKTHCYSTVFAVRIDSPTAR